MKQLVYIETTVVSYYTGRATRDVIIALRQEETRLFWPKLLNEYDAYISGLVYDEAGDGDPEAARKRLEALEPFPILQVNDAATVLADLLLSEKAVPSKYPEDAMHIAIAAVNGMQVLITWNFSHINNPFKRMMIRQVVENAGYRCPEICSPDELMEVEE
jgi:hypothetical protein